MKWKEMSVFYKTIFVFRVLCCASAFFFIILDIAGGLENGMAYAFLFSGADYFFCSIENWKKRKGFAIFSFAFAAFFVIASIYILIMK